MATEFLLPNGDNGGWTTGGFADIDELVSAPDDGNFIETAANGKGEAILLDLVDSARVDADTINTVTVHVRARLNAGTPATVAIELLIGGIVQGASQNTAVLGSSFADYTLNVVQWNIDWTAAELDGMQVRCTAQQTGMPVDIQVQVSACDVEVDYSEAAGSFVDQGTLGNVTVTGFAGTVDLGVTADQSEQEGFRWRNDNGSESAATWRQDQDVHDTVAQQANIRLRMLVDHEQNPASVQVTLQYKRKDEAPSEWRDV